jgi:hypothetical protein
MWVPTYDAVNQQGTQTSLFISLELPFKISHGVSAKTLTITWLEPPNNHQMVLNNLHQLQSHLGGGTLGPSGTGGGVGSAY